VQNKKKRKKKKDENNLRKMGMNISVANRRCLFNSTTLIEMTAHLSLLVLAKDWQYRRMFI